MCSPLNSHPTITATTGVTYVTVLAIELPAEAIIEKFQM